MESTNRADEKPPSPRPSAGSRQQSPLEQQNTHREGDREAVGNGRRRRRRRALTESEKWARRPRRPPECGERGGERGGDRQQLRPWLRRFRSGGGGGRKPATHYMGPGLSRDFGPSYTVGSGFLQALAGLLPDGPGRLVSSSVSYQQVGSNKSINRSSFLLVMELPSSTTKPGIMSPLSLKVYVNLLLC